MDSIVAQGQMTGMWWAVFGPLHFLALVAVFAALRSLQKVLKGNTEQNPALVVGLCLNAAILSGLAGAFLILTLNHSQWLTR